MNQSRLALALLLLSGTATAKTWSSVDDDLARKISKAHALRPSEPAPGVPTSVELGPDQVVEGREDESTVSYQTVRSNIDYESTKLHFLYFLNCSLFLFHRANAAFWAFHLLCRQWTSSDGRPRSRQTIPGRGPSMPRALGTRAFRKTPASPLALTSLKIVW